MSHVEEIKEKLSVEDVLGSYLKLEKAGASFKALCPFHHEKTASFFISPARGTYYCFGCGMKGDIFSFVEEFEGVDFKGALKILAEKAGVKIVFENPKLKSEKDRLFACLEEATTFFSETLNREENGKIREYLKGRGLTPETILEWHIGFAPLDWHPVHSYLKQKGYTDSEIEKAGLIKRAEASHEKGVRFYDRFRGRIMFPINDSSGRVIGFSGRIFQDDGKSAKYINSPETELYLKSSVLFGLDKAKSAIRQEGEIILVEGQMDIILSHQAGVRNTVALSGTAFTESHAKIIHRFSNRLILAFDPDSAGVKAARRSAVIALREGLEVKAALLPSGVDPADYILHNSKKWKDILANSVNIVHFSLAQILSSTAQKSNLPNEIKENIFPFLYPLGSSMERSQYIQEIAKKTGISENAIIEDYRKAERSYEPEGETGNQGVIREKKLEEKSHRNLVERRIYGILLWQNSLGAPSIDVKRVEETLKNIIGAPGFEKMTDFFAPNKNELASEAEVLYNTANTAEDLEELFMHLEQDYLKGNLAIEIEKLSLAEKNTDKDQIAEILKRCKELGERIQKLVTK
ncbi:MAG: DNA primase [Candidatus Taylorbacteria bacterium]